MKRVAYYVLFMLMLAALACGAPNVSPESTATLIEPSATLEPTDTPFPTDTPTHLPTATADVAATAAVRATESASDVFNELDYIRDFNDFKKIKK